MIYFDWLVECVCDDVQRVHFQRLFSYLYNREFTWFVKNDVNRLEDGLELRRLFERETGGGCEKRGPCSVLEVLVALAIRCENDIMYDPEEGDRTHLWFWVMMENLGLDKMSDNEFSYELTEEIVDIFLDRRYSSDGHDGPFYVPGCRIDMTKTELWYQLNYYLNYFLRDTF